MHWEVLAELPEPLYATRITASEHGWAVVGQSHMWGIRQEELAGVRLFTSAEGFVRTPANERALLPNAKYDASGALHLSWVEPESWGADGSGMALSGREARARVGYSKLGGEGWAAVTWPLDWHFSRSSIDAPRIGLTTGEVEREPGVSIVVVEERELELDGPGVPGRLPPTRPTVVLARQEGEAAWESEDLGQGRGIDVVSMLDGAPVVAFAGVPFGTLASVDASQATLGVIGRPLMQGTRTDTLWTDRDLSPTDPRFSVGADGDLHMIWRSAPGAQRPPHLLWYSRAPAGGGDWIAPRVIWGSEEGGLTVANRILLFRSPGGLHALFQTGLHEGRAEVQHLVMTGSGWSEPERMNYESRSESVVLPSVDTARTPDGRVYAVLTELLDGTESDPEYRTLVLRLVEPAR